MEEKYPPGLNLWTSSQSGSSTGKMLKSYSEVQTFRQLHAFRFDRYETRA